VRGDSLHKSWGGLEHAGSALQRRGHKPTSAAALLPSLQDAGHQETVRLAELLLPGGTLTQWQRSWCTPENVNRYYKGRGGNPAAAAAILAQALQWREEYRDVLSGEREPSWQVDFRVLARGDDGFPIIYGCLRFSVPATPLNTRHIVEHMAAVMEAANRARRQGAFGADHIYDLHGFRLTDNLNPAPLLALVKMVSQAYRDGLRRAILVDAPCSFTLFWRVAAPLLSENTRKKVCFVSREAAVELVACESGPQASTIVDRVMTLNRGVEGCIASSFPSEVRDDDADAAEHEGHPMLRKLSHQPTRTLSSGVQSVRKESSRKPWFFCCRRRRPEPSPHGSRIEHVN